MEDSGAARPSPHGAWPVLRDLGQADDDPRVNPTGRLRTAGVPG
jgi:hypothetical protein